LDRVLRIHDTKAGEVVPFVPSGDVVRLFTCGPTVYARPHLGHGKTYLLADTLRRVLEWLGYEVRHAMNYTDVSDETALEAAKEGIGEIELAERYVGHFEQDMTCINLLPPHVRPRVSEHVDDVVRLIAKLVDEGKAYPLNGEVYLRAGNGDFGQLLHTRLEDVIVKDEQTDLGGKESPMDVLLWERGRDGWNTWGSPWGAGRPGWQTQDIVMSHSSLGLPVDIHTGGNDLFFPHHESEMLIGREAYGAEPVRHWVHNAFVTLQGEKLSKARGGVISLEDLCDDWCGGALRLFLLKHHYREPTPYSGEAIKNAALDYHLIREAWEMVSELDAGDAGGEPQGEALGPWQKLVNHVLDDLHTDLAVNDLKELAALTLDRIGEWDGKELEGARTAWRDARWLLGVPFEKD